MHNKSKTTQHILITVCIVFLINWFGNSFYTRFDLTEDQRFTMSEITQNEIENLEDTIRFSVYLHGDLPLTFSKMKREVADFLEAIKRIGGNKIEIKYIDPLQIGETKKEKKAAFNRLTQKYGLKPYTIQEQDETGKYERRFIVPGIIVSTSSSFVPVNLFSNVIGNTTDEQVYEALGALEYMCLKSIRQLTQTKPKKIAYITNQNEASDVYVHDAISSLKEFYTVEKITTWQLLDSLNTYDIALIADPTSAFSPEDKFILDQYLMHNGNLLCFFDKVYTNADSLQHVSHTLALPKQLQISDFLFHLGIRIKNTLLLDNQCAKVPLNMSQPGMQPNYQPVPWYYSPLLRGHKKHEITKDISLVKSDFAGTIDTVEGGGNLQKTILLNSSAYAREIQAPVEVGFSILERIGGNYFKDYYVPVATLNEGDLYSFYTNRACPITTEKLPPHFTQKMKSDSNKIIFVADADIIKNEVEINGLDTVPKPLHYYKYFAIDNKIYTGNKEFLLNAANYLSNDTDFIPLRTQDIQIRLLNKKRILQERTNWQLLNIGVPIIILIITGLIIMFVRKRKYNRHAS
ncbi:MAG: gliding motility-associated ABC transporter substrate-binding protein GldG [Bacteroidales bacterium]